VATQMSATEEECRLTIVVAYCWWCLGQGPLVPIRLLDYKRALGLSATSALAPEGTAL